MTKPPPWTLATLALAALGAATAAALLATDPARGWADLLIGGFLFASLSLSGPLLISVHLLSRAGWWVALRRVPEAMGACLPAAAPLLLLLVFGRAVLYPWARPGAAADPAIAAKGAWLSAPAFFARMALFLGIWTLFALALRRASRAEDEGGGLAPHRRMVRLAAGFVPVFAVTYSLASFDWLMSLQPAWYSTIFAVYCFAGLLLGGVAAVTLAAVALARRGPLAGRLSEAHLADLGTLLFAFSTFWAYIWVSQYLLIWYGNLSEEIPFYLARTRGGWLPLFLLVPALSWLVPFLALMTRAAKGNPRVLSAVAATVLAGRWLDLYVMVAPPVLGGPRLGLLDLAVGAGYLALFLYLAARAFRGAPALPTHDPYLAESLAHGRPAMMPR